MPAWERFFCVTCQGEHPIADKMLRTVYKGSRKIVKVMCAKCCAGKRANPRPYHWVDAEDVQIPQRVIDACIEANEADA